MAHDTKSLEIGLRAKVHALDVLMPIPFKWPYLVDVIDFHHALIPKPRFTRSALPVELENLFSFNGVANIDLLTRESKALIPGKAAKCALPQYRDEIGDLVFSFFLGHELFLLTNLHPV